ncbi:lipocalin family protein [Roseateles depolymerans]|uniref:Lipocalin family protein n=1 Tax=Roseateles depolymerans TaxID=76731 RepID=A0A0U3LMB9_9BURK|nr:lipocalin family protein [Roseateles depolymerans]ALV06039.1 Lipocalin family protein [Roseateles depolymerans]REG11985.1 lipocalin [Roseateles depolymerans]
MSLLPFLSRRPATADDGVTRPVGATAVAAHDKGAAYEAHAMRSRTAPTPSTTARPVTGLGRFCSLAMLACLSAALMVLPADPVHADEAPLPTVSTVDLARYAGSWYEITKLPNRFQKQCVADTQAEYRLDGDIVRVINRCRTSTGELDDIKGRAKVVPGSGNAKLKVTFFWPFYGDYWVLALDPDYREVLVGAPDRKYAWILSRTPTMPQARVDALLQRAKALGFDADAFVATPQTQPLTAVQPAAAPAALPAPSAP